MRNIKLTIEYVGTHFHGWQTQTKNQPFDFTNSKKINLLRVDSEDGAFTSKIRAPMKSQRTVQGEITKALKKIFNTNLKLIGSGRTDSGVHALGQVANFKIKSTISTQEIRNALNANLPEDIVIRDIAEVPLNFHAQYSVKSKTYRYTIFNGPTRPVIDRHCCLFYPYKLNLRAMKKEAEALIGRKNFKSFQASNPAKRLSDKKWNTTRTVKRVNIRRAEDKIYIDIEADGFLYKMVRTTVGTLLSIGSGKLPKGSMKKILAQKNRNFAGVTAKAHGLCLLKVSY